MKAYSIISNTYFKLLLELVIIFLSVVLAFFFDDYRESKNEESQYKKDLLTFRQAIVGEIGDRGAKLDSFYVTSDLPYRGAKLKRLLNLIWFDSLIDHRKAKLIDFKYLVRHSYLLSDYQAGSNYTPMATQILLKYAEQIRDESLVPKLSIYVEEMSHITELNKEIYNDYSELNKFIRKMDPYLNFDKEDSLLLYSKEFIWNFKNIVTDEEDQFFYTKWRVQKRLISILIVIDQELKLLNVSVSEHEKCISTSYRLRFECGMGRALNEGDTILRIKDIVERRRNEFIGRQGI